MIIPTESILVTSSYVNTPATPKLPETDKLPVRLAPVFIACTLTLPSVCLIAVASIPSQFNVTPTGRARNGAI